MSRTSTLGLVVVAALAAAPAVSPADPPPPAEPVGIAARYPNDAGIKDDPRVLFADNFDAWETDTAKPPAGTWDAVRGSEDPKQRRTLVVAGAVTLDGKAVPGKNVLRLACHHKGPNVAGLRKHLGNYSNPREGKGAGHEEVYVRYYQRLDDGYAPERNHGSNLGGRDLTQPGAWSVGMANTRDVAEHGYFYSGLQPYPAARNTSLYWGFYSYHLDKPTPWGDDYKPRPEEKSPISVGRWYCVERHMKLNKADPLAADGVEELWVDGKRVISREGLRFRRVPGLRITVFELEVYYHGLPEKYTAEKPISVSFDNVVVATERIGCLSPPRP